MRIAATRRRRSLGTPIWLAGLAVGIAAVVLGAVFATRQIPPSADELRTAVAEIAGAYRCADLSYTVTPERGVSISGFAASAADITGLRQAIGGLRGLTAMKFAVAPRIWPYCEAVARLKPLLAQAETRVPRLALASPDQQAHVGSPLVLEITMPAFDGYVYVDYFSATGEVLHLLPNDKDTINLRPKRNNFVLGKPPMRRCWLLAGESGQELIAGLVSALPLFPMPRAEIEQASAYLPKLSEALVASGSRPQAAGILFFDLQPAKSFTPPEESCTPR